MRMIALTATFVFVTGLSSSTIHGDEPPQRFPEFTLADIASGEARSLSDYRGRRVLLIQFASW